MKQLVKFCKDFLLFVPITFLFKPFTKAFLFIAYFNKLVSWIRKHKHEFEFNDYYTPVRDYNKRYQLYEFVQKRNAKVDEPLIYLEYGVAAGESFRWWLQHNQHTDSRFFGFDTFEGLPEKWGSFYDKGSMKFSMPEQTDTRGTFVKGLFQDTLPAFIRENRDLLSSQARKVILLDADLYSATIYTLSQLYPTLRKGDVILFDEFSVAMHEFKAFLEFTGNFYIQLKPLGAVNNFYQVGFEVA